MVEAHHGWTCCLRILVGLRGMNLALDEGGGLDFHHDVQREDDFDSRRCSATAARVVISGLPESLSAD
jgi:hypothetical protein